MEMEHPKVLVNEGPPSGGNPIGFQGIFPGEGIGMDSARTEREIARQTVETVGMLGVGDHTALVTSSRPFAHSAPPSFLLTCTAHSL